ncbi:MAG: ABC transporter ATP-binding protein [Candidatus Eremiobacteraeota bacterium]|nr:ABC transporter ATP-binding protein [Candidatus Eremiobacteraeota bacterium]MBV8370259.1 ABC transporter ATP-binding protein [Candidatus Eremiobacteraeota bacterium]
MQAREPDADTTETIVDVRDVVKIHAPGTPTEVRALDGVTFAVRAGEYVAIVGESGSGKTTLMHVLGGLDRPTSGDVVVEGRSLARTSRRQLAAIRARAIGFVFQGFNLLPNLDARENVALAARYARRGGNEAASRAERVLREVGLGDRMHHRPSALSGGQQQRVAIARALVNEPALLLADEPTGELDSRTAETVLELLSALNARGQTLLVVTHSEAVYRRARRVIRLADGKIVADDAA